ncbi:MAG: AmmeMemoRadiSam system protein B, partial [Armatimonadetes bacterium]|nr:AmmeMemoRadiSam system protein B [Armatimonadota bacterium]
MGKRVIIVVVALAFVVAAVVAGLDLTSPAAHGPAQTVSTSAVTQISVRPPAVAGAFYPGRADELRTYIDRRLADAPVADVNGRVIGLLCPHAGYDYCGQVAAAGYAAVRGKRYDAVIVTGPAHHMEVDGAAVGEWTVWETPLGTVPVDMELSRELQQACPAIRADAPGSEALRPEHSIETQLPWLQVALGQFKFVPLLISDFSAANCDGIARAIADVCAKRDVLLVASTDLAHYPAYDDCVRVDRGIIEAVETMDVAAVCEKDVEILHGGTRNLFCTMCGLGPVTVVMNSAKSLGADRAVVLARANSGDVPSGDHDRCVGYAAVAFIGPERQTQTPSEEDETVSDASCPTGAGSEGELNEEQQKELLALARETIARHVAGQPLPPLPTGPDIYQKERAVFVTLNKHGQLRGCIGALEAQEPLVEAVRRYAIAAATQDPRFPPVTADEVPDLHIEISVLSPLRKIDSPDEIVVGKHGVVVRQGFHSGVFLPQVAPEQGWDRDTMLNMLCAHKAGLPMVAWKHGADLYV